MNSLKSFFFITASLTFGLMAGFIILEIILSFFPVRQATTSLPVNQATQFFHYKPNQSYLWSMDPWFSKVSIKKTNNYGYFNDQEYFPQDSRPLIAVIGDSYVEASQIPNPLTFHGILSDLLKANKINGRIYSFGSNGAPLSQYLSYAINAKEVFNPVAMVFVIIGNDFDESIITYKNSPGYHYFPNDSDSSELIRVDYTPSPWIERIKSSHLIRYLFFNCNIQSLWNIDSWKGKSTLANKFIGQTSSNADTKRIEDSKMAVRLFLRKLPEKSGLPPDKIQFILDGIRPHLYSKELMANAKRSFVNILKTYFKNQAHSQGYNVLDMQPIFQTHFEKTGEKFEFPTDGHWNELGHRIVAEAITKTKIFNRSLDLQIP